MQLRLARVNQLLQEQSHSSKSIFEKLGFLKKLIEEEEQDNTEMISIQYRFKRKTILENLQQIIQSLNDEERDIISNIHILTQHAHENSYLKNSLRQEEFRRKRLKERCKEQFQELCHKYKLLLEVDLAEREVNEIAKHDLGYSSLNQSMHQTTHSINNAYRNLLNQSSHYSSSAKQLMDKLTAFRRDLNRYEEKIYAFETKRLNMFNEKYVYSKSYKNDISKLHGVLEKVSATFSEYTNGRWKFHWFRSHSKEADAVVNKISHIMRIKAENALQEAHQYILKLLHQMEIQNRLNLTGSFSRRAHFCLKLIDEEMKLEKPFAPR